jgi:N-acetyl-alpha-D-glucosaminyl L-malate synthase BshA
MNIAILCYHRLGGSGILAYEIGRAMAEERGHMVHFMGLEPPFRLEDNDSETMKFHKVHVKDYPVFDFQPYTLALASQLSELICRCHIDIIHSHYALPHAIAALLAKDIAGKPNIKCITTLHGTDITIVGAHPTMKNITRHAILRSDLVTAVSNSLRQETEDVFKIAPGKITTIYNFINPEMFHPAEDNDFSCKRNDKIIVVHVSNLRDVKAPLDVIRIFYGISKRVKCPIELWVIGEGPLQEEMIREAELLSIENQVKFIGVRSNFGFLIARCHLMLLPSKKEAFGLAALEAMACGVPVTASRVGGLPELIEDNKTGILFSPGNLEEAITKSAALLNDPEKHKKIRQAAMESVKVKFAMNTIIDQYEALYAK